MPVRPLLLLLAAACLVGACAAPAQQPQPSVRPPDADCVGKTECDVPVDPLAGMVAENMFTSRGRTTLLRWTLNGHEGRYRWQEDGIVFEPAAAAVIRCPGGQSGPVRTCTNNGGVGSTNGRFKYDVRILDSRTGQVITLDPFVVNR